MTFTLEDKIACLEREVNRRKKTYPNRLATRRMSAKEVYRETETMKQVLDDYLALLEKDDLFSREVVDTGP